MKKSVKIILIVLGILAAGIVLLLLLAGELEKKNRQTEIPGGSLSDDFFVSQNMIYEESPNLPSLATFPDLPYSIGLPDVLSGDVGSGTVFHVSDDTNLYVSEKEKAEGVADHFMAEYPQAVLIHTDPKKNIFTTFAQRNGYINGFAAEYFVGKAQIFDDNTKTEVYVVGYNLIVSEYPFDITIAATTREYTTENLYAVEQYVVSVIKTLQFDDAKYKELKEAEEKRLKAEEEKRLEEERKALEGEEVSEEEKDPQVPANAIVQIEEILLPHDFENLVLDYAWENTDTMIEAKLYSTEGYTFTPVRYEKGHAIFELGKFKEGSYQMEVKGMEYGKTTYTVWDER